MGGSAAAVVKFGNLTAREVRAKWMLFTKSNQAVNLSPRVFPLMLQGWHEITFFHWSAEPALVQQRLPPGLTVDIINEQAWVSLTPFLLTGLRPPLFPRRLGLTFPEMNLRTYVRGPSGPGIWFFSLDAARLSAV